MNYWRLLRNHQPFRRLWLGEVISLTGDWFTSIALFTMLLELTGKGEALGLVLIARFLPAFLFGPMAGVAGDRFSRKTIMITCDLLRSIVVLGFLFIRQAQDVWLAYLLTFVHLSLTAFFEPAEQAAIGSILDRRDMVTGNTLSSMTWSAMLAIGAMLGGIVTAMVGRRWAFIFDSATFLLSAIFIRGAAIPRQAARKKSDDWIELLGWRDLKEGVKYVLRERGVRKVLMAKAGWALAAGGALLLYPVFGQRVFPLGANAAASIGLLYGARGVGAFLGPMAAASIGGADERGLQRAIGISFVLMAVGYGLFALAPTLFWGAACLMVAHMAISTVWTFSNALINLWVPSNMLGRIFAADLGLFTLMLTFSTYGTGYGLDHAGLGPRAMMGILAASLTVPAVLWHLFPANRPAP